MRVVASAFVLMLAATSSLADQAKRGYRRKARFPFSSIRSARSVASFAEALDEQGGGATLV